MNSISYKVDSDRFFAALLAPGSLAERWAAARATLPSPSEPESLNTVPPRQAQGRNITGVRRYRDAKCCGTRQRWWARPDGTWDAPHHKTCPTCQAVLQYGLTFPKWARKGNR